MAILFVLGNKYFIVWKHASVELLTGFLGSVREIMTLILEGGERKCNKAVELKLPKSPSKILIKSTLEGSYVREQTQKIRKNHFFEAVRG